MKLILAGFLFFISLGVSGAPYVWDDGKQFIWDKPSNITSEPKTLSEVESRRLTNSPRIYMPPISYGQGVNMMMTEPTTNYRFIPRARSLGEGERNRLFDLR